MNCAVKKAGITAIVGLCVVFARPANAQLVDADTLLYLNFNNTLTGAAGETPTIATSTAFAGGISGAGTSFSNNTVLAYAAANNINAQNGTLEFFLKPNWNGGDVSDPHILLSWGEVGSMLFAKDGFPNLRQIVNRRLTEADTAVNGGILSANTWYNIAYTWNNDDKILKLYVDGVLRDTEVFGFDLPDISAPNFFIGSDNGGTGPITAQGVIDELRISNRERSSSEINAYRDAFLAISAPEPGTLPLLAGGSFLGAGVLAWQRRRKSVT